MTSTRLPIGPIAAVALLVMAPAVAAAQEVRSAWGTLRGRVVFEGVPPRPQPIDLGAEGVPDGSFLAGRDGPVYASPRLLVEPRSQGVRDALVFLVEPTAIREEAAAAARKPVPFQFDRGVFVPHVLPVMTGTEVAVFTVDPIACNLRFAMPLDEFRVRTVDHPEGLRPSGFFNGLLRPEGRFTLVPEPTGGRRRARPIPAEVADDIHPWNRAYWVVLDHPYFAVTDARGEFAIADVPTGEQRVVVWHERIGWVGPRHGRVVAIDPASATDLRVVLTPEELRR